VIGTRELFDSLASTKVSEHFSASGSIDPLHGDRQQRSEHFDRR
jgi:hypothetical protein